MELLAVFVILSTMNDEYLNHGKNMHKKSSLLKRFIVYIGFFCLLLFIYPDYSHAAIGTNLIHTYKFDGDLFDSTGSDDFTNTGTLFSTYGKKFGTNSVLSGGYYTGIVDSTFPTTVFDGDFTIHFWIRFNSGGYGEWLLEAYDPSYSNYWFSVLRSTTGQLSINMYDGPSNGNNNPSFLTTCAITDTTTTHQIIITRNTSTALLTAYIDGANCGSVTDTTVGHHVSASVFSFLSNHAAQLGTPAGADELYIWNRALSSTEIGTMWDGNNGLECPINCNTTSTATSSQDYIYSNGSINTSNIFSMSSTTLTFGAIDYSACDVTSININPFASSSLSWGTFAIPSCILQSFKLLFFGLNGFDTYNITNFVNSSSSTLPFLMFKFMGGALVYINPLTGELINLPNASSSLVFSIPLFGTSSPVSLDINASSSVITKIHLPDPIDKAASNIEMAVFFVMWAIIFRYINI